MPNDSIHVETTHQDGTVTTSSVTVSDEEQAERNARAALRTYLGVSSPTAAQTAAALKVLIRYVARAD
jgi:hypothetical protein